MIEEVRFLSVDFFHFPPGFSKHISFARHRASLAVRSTEMFILPITFYWNDYFEDILCSLAIGSALCFRVCARRKGRIEQHGIGLWQINCLYTLLYCNNILRLWTAHCSPATLFKWRVSVCVGRESQWIDSDCARLFHKCFSFNERERRFKMGDTAI